MISSDGRLLRLLPDAFMPSGSVFVHLGHSYYFNHFQYTSIQKADLKLTICKSGLQHPKKELKYRLIMFTLEGFLDWQEGLHDLISLCGDSMSKNFVPHRRSEGSVC